MVCVYLWMCGVGGYLRRGVSDPFHLSLSVFSFSLCQYYCVVPPYVHVYSTQYQCTPYLVVLWYAVQYVLWCTHADTQCVVSLDITSPHQEMVCYSLVLCCVVWCYLQWCLLTCSVQLCMLYLVVPTACTSTCTQYLVPGVLYVVYAQLCLHVESSSRLRCWYLQTSHHHIMRWCVTLWCCVVLCGVTSSVYFSSCSVQCVLYTAPCIPYHQYCIRSTVYVVPSTQCGGVVQLLVLPTHLVCVPLEMGYPLDIQLVVSGVVPSSSVVCSSASSTCSTSCIYIVWHMVCCAVPSVCSSWCSTSCQYLPLQLVVLCYHSSCWCGDTIWRCKMQVSLSSVSLVSSLPPCAQWCSVHYPSAPYTMYCTVYVVPSTQYLQWYAVVCWCSVLATHSTCRPLEMYLDMYLLTSSWWCVVLVPSSSVVVQCQQCVHSTYCMYMVVCTQYMQCSTQCMLQLVLVLAVSTYHSGDGVSVLPPSSCWCGVVWRYLLVCLLLQCLEIHLVWYAVPIAWYVQYWYAVPCTMQCVCMWCQCVALYSLGVTQMWCCVVYHLLRRVTTLEMQTPLTIQLLPLLRSVVVCVHMVCYAVHYSMVYVVLVCSTPCTCSVQHVVLCVSTHQVLPRCGVGGTISLDVLPHSVDVVTSNHLVLNTTPQCVVCRYTWYGMQYTYSMVCIVLVCSTGTMQCVHVVWCVYSLGVTQMWCCVVYHLLGRVTTLEMQTPLTIQPSHHVVCSAHAMLCVHHMYIHPVVYVVPSTYYLLGMWYAGVEQLVCCSSTCRRLPLVGGIHLVVRSSVSLGLVPFICLLIACTISVSCRWCAVLSCPPVLWVPPALRTASTYCSYHVPWYPHVIPQAHLSLRLYMVHLSSFAHLQYIS